MGLEESYFNDRKMKPSVTGRLKPRTCSVNEATPLGERGIAIEPRA